MKKIILFFTGCLMLLHFALAQDTRTYGILSNIDGMYYVETNGRTYLAETSVVTVKFKNGITKSHIRLDSIRANKLGFIDIAVPHDTNLEEFVLLLKSSNDFESVDYNGFGESHSFTPNDIKLGDQWYLSYIKAFDAWDLTTGSASIKVAILDTGMDFLHEDIGYGNDGYKNIDETLGKNYLDPNASVNTGWKHGTEVGGVLGAKSNNTIGIAGISGGNGSTSGVTMIPMMVCVMEDKPSSEYVQHAIIDAVDNGARIINMSFGVTQTNGIQGAIAYAVQNNVVLVASSGNIDNLLKPLGVGYPARHQEVIAVGAVVQEDTLRWYRSERGPELDIVAPGAGMWTTTLNNGYRSTQGTSFAAPIISGIAALVLSVNPHLTGQQVRNIIESTAQKISPEDSYGVPIYEYDSVQGRHNGTWNEEMGYGLVDAHASVQAALETICHTGLPIVHGTITQNTTWNTPVHATGNITVPNGITLTITSEVNYEDWVSIIVEPGGKLVLDGGTLTNACPDQMWQGVTVMGDPNLPPSTIYQGYVQQGEKIFFHPSV